MYIDTPLYRITACVLYYWEPKSYGILMIVSKKMLKMLWTMLDCTRAGYGKTALLLKTNVEISKDVGALIILLIG